MDLMSNVTEKTQRYWLDKRAPVGTLECHHGSVPDLLWKIHVPFFAHVKCQFVITLLDRKDQKCG